MAISLSNCAAIEIVDDKYRLILSAPVDEPEFLPHAIKSYWTYYDNTSTYHWNRIKHSTEFNSLDKLIELGGKL